MAVTYSTQKSPFFHRIWDHQALFGVLDLQGRKVTEGILHARCFIGDSQGTHRKRLLLLLRPPQGKGGSGSFRINLGG